MAELNFTAPSPVMMNAFLKAMIKQNRQYATSSFSDKNREAPIVCMTISPSDNVRQFKFPSPLNFEFLKQSENIRYGINHTVIMLYTVNVDDITQYNYCDLLIFDHRWGTATLYGTNFYAPYKNSVSKFCDQVGYDLRCGSSSFGIHKYDRLPVIQGTSLFAAWKLHRIITLTTEFGEFPTSHQLYEFGRKYFPDCMPLATPVTLARMLPNYVNRHRSPELERFDFNIRIPGFFEGCRAVPDCDPTWDFSFDGRRLESWRRYKYVLQVWNVNGVRKYLVKAEKARTSDSISLDVPRFEREVSEEHDEIPSPPYKIRREVYYPPSSARDFLPNPHFNDALHFEEPYVRNTRNQNHQDFQVELVKAYPRYSWDQLPVHGIDGAVLEVQDDEDKSDIDHAIPYLHPFLEIDSGYTSE